MQKKNLDRRQILPGIILGGVAIAVLLLVIALLHAATTNSWPNFAAEPTPDFCTDVSAVDCVYRLYGKEELYQSVQGREFKTSLTGPNGFVITLERAYADANLVLISYSYRSPADRNFYPGVILKDARGKELREEGNSMSPLTGSQVAVLRAYDGSELVPTGNPPEVMLRLEIPSVYGDYEHTPPASNAPTPQPQAVEVISLIPLQPPRKPQ